LAGLFQLEKRGHFLRRFYCCTYGRKGRLKMINKANLKTCLGISMFFLLMAGQAQAATITVGSGAGYDYDSIQVAIDAAVDGDTVLVAPGEYVITEPVTFRGKAITVISEAGPDETTIRMGTPADPERGSVVVLENNETDASVLEGFTITGGRGSWMPSDDEWGGGGILFDASSGTVRNCAIVQNTTVWGGGVCCINPCSVTLIDCTIAENVVEEDGGGVGAWNGSSMNLINCIIRGNSTTGVEVIGGGVGCGSNSSVTMTDCIISGNSSADAGGGVACWQASLILTRCAILNNTGGDYFGGGVYAGHGSATLTNCLIARNTTPRGGGGVASSYPDASVTISNCTIWGNSGGSEWGGGGVLCRQASAVVTNSIIWGNTSPKGPEISVEDPTSTLTIAYSNVAGGQAGVNVEGVCTLNWGLGNIDADPCFAEPGYWSDINDPNIIVGPDDPNAVWIDGDYHLKSEAGRWKPYSESWVLDDVTSPCIDRGDTNSPVGDEPDPNGGIINMGAYGGTPEASMSIGQLPPLPPPIPLTHWNLDETKGTIAYDSVGDHDGTLNGNPLWQPAGGQVAGALEFDGIDDYVETDFVLNPADGPFCVFAWIKGGAPGQIIMSQTDSIGGIGAIWLGADSSGGNLMTGLVPPPGGRSIRKPLVSEIVVIDSQWHLIGFVWDGSIRALCVDGIEVAKDMQAKLEGSDGGLHICAGKNLEVGTFFSGLIDDVRIYNKALSTEEIEALAQ
jgi:hypothetical protein